MSGNGNGHVADLDIVGTFEAHLILGVERSRLARWLEENGKGKHSIAEPVKLRCGPIWTRAQIEAKLRELFEEDRGRPPADAEELRKWARPRSVKRWKALTPSIPRRELERILL